MRLVVVPPVTDPTLTVTVGTGERLLDLSRRFGLRAADPVVLRATGAALDVPGTGAAERCLLAMAAADALAGPASAAVWPQAVAAAIRVLSATDPGLSASIDDIELRTGSTECGADATLAATRCTLFDPELSAVPAARDVHVVLDSDQQLPAALRLLGRLRSSGTARGRPVTVGGRLVAAQRDALSLLPALSGVRLDTGTRPRVIGAGWLPGHGTGLRWCGDGDEPPDAGLWAGWLDAAAAGALTRSQLERCAGLVVSVTGSADQAGPEARARVALTELAAARVPVAVEVVVGAPGGDTSPGAWWALPGSPVRLAGFRPYRPRLPADTAPPPGHDLARWAAPAAAVTMAEVGGLLAHYAPRRDLFPGRVAGALFAPTDRPRICGDHYWDPAVRLVRTEHATPDDGAPGDFLVNLRSGALTRVRPALAALLARMRQGGPPAERAVGTLASDRRERLLAGLAAAGAVHKERPAS
jgi:hypothetical protein